MVNGNSKFRVFGLVRAVIVKFQTRFVLVRPFAALEDALEDMALVFLLMSKQMLLEVAAAGKLFVAETAFIWLLASVSSYVSVQITFLREPHLTVLKCALIWLEVVVDPLVLVKGRYLWERFVAYLALVWS